MKNHVLYFNQPNQVIVQEEAIPKPKENALLVKNYISGISAGTEMLLYKGLMPTNIALDESISSLKNTPHYPCKYGYCSVGKIIETANKKSNHLLNRWVFVFNPHESYFWTNEEQMLLLPENITPHDALFISNLETAINLILDGVPLIGERVLVLGLGIVGLLTTALLGQYPLSLLIGVDFYEKRREMAIELGIEHVFDAQCQDVDLEIKNYLKNAEIDLIYELTGNPKALNQAILHAGFEGRIILGSWYGKKACSLDLGGKFHRSRIQLIASQVSTIASKLQGRWTKHRRFDLVFQMLEKIKPSRFISHNFSIHDAHKAYQLLDAHPDDTLQVTLSYEDQ